MGASLPVLMYHYISNSRSSIAVPPQTFEAHCASLAESGWRGIGMEEAESYFLRGKSLPRRVFLMTFDDGYLDNYVYAYPILQKYGHKATVFAVTKRLEEGARSRHTLNDVWEKRITAEQLPPVDTPDIHYPEGFSERHDQFINWSEARLMERTGVIHVGAHTATHANVFTAPNFSSYFLPRTCGRTFYYVDSPMPWGLPNFPVAPAMQARAWLPSEALLDCVQTLVPQDKSEAYAFAQNPEQMEKLKAHIARFTPETLGRYETDEEQKNRLYEDLSACKERLERELGRTEKTLCWPWGAASPLAQEIAKRLGFSMFFYTSCGYNPPLCAEHIHRFKVRNESCGWLKRRLYVYRSPLLSALYGRIKR